MSPLLEHLDPLARLTLQALLNTLGPGLLIIALCALSSRLIGRPSATSRHAIWLVGLLALCLLPALPTRESAAPAPASIAASELPIAPRQPAESVAPSVPLKMARQFLPSVQLTFREEELASWPSSPSRGKAAPVSVAFGGARQGIKEWWARMMSGRLPLAIVSLWAAVSLVMLWRLGRSCFFMIRLRRRLGPVPASTRARVDELSASIGLRRTVEVGTSEMVGMPMTIGAGRPLIILPGELTRALSIAEIDSIIAHELAHIKRWDYLTNLLQRLVQAFLFFHPAVWVIGRHLLIERELACDDWAIKITGEPRRYATCLTRLVATLGTGKPLAVATGIIFGKHIISRRIEMILNRDRNATTAVSKAALCYACGSAAVAVFLCSSFSPAIAVPAAPVAQTGAARVAPPAPSGPPARPTIAPAPAPVVPATPTPARVEMVADLPFYPPDGPDVPDVPEAIEAVPAAAAVAAIPVAAVGPAMSIGPVVNDVWELIQTPAAAPRAPRQEPAVASTVARARRRDEPPAIPEAELLGVLSEIVKRDADPAVRNEALRGISRLRSDEAVNTLIQLYDVVPDVKAKSEILGSLVRSEGDNSKAIAKLLAVARNEKDDSLRSRALSQLARIKGDEGVNHLISIYDGLQDAKQKQLVIRYLAANKSRKAIDKLIQIAKNDADPLVRQAAVRGLYAIDNNLYIDLRDRAFPRVGSFSIDPEKFAQGFGGRLSPNFKFDLEGLAPEFHFELKDLPDLDEIRRLQEDAFEQLQGDALERSREALEKSREEIERLRESNRDAFDKQRREREELKSTTPRPRKN